MKKALIIVIGIICLTNATISAQGNHSVSEIESFLNHDDDLIEKYWEYDEALALMVVREKSDGAIAEKLLDFFHDFRYQFKKAYFDSEGQHFAIQHLYFGVGWNFNRVTGDLDKNSGYESNYDYRDNIARCKKYLKKRYGYSF